MSKFLQAICRLFCPKPTEPENLLSYKEIVSMLRAYDNSRPEAHKKMFGFEDTRVSTFNFAAVKNYLAYAEELANEKGITLTGISFVKGVYSQDTTSDKRTVNYENLMYLPKAMVNGEEVLVDLVNSTSEKIVTFKEMLERHGYAWYYDNAKSLEESKKEQKQEKMVLKSAKMNSSSGDDTSFVANRGHLSPPL